MKRPSTRTLFLGHPLVAVPVGIAGLSTLYICWLGGKDGIGIGLLAVLMMAAVGRASSEANAYSKWQREWDAMAGHVPAAGGEHKGLARLALGALFVCGGIALATAYPSLLLTVGLPLVILIAVGVWLRARRHRPARARQAAPVEVVATPSAPTSTLDAAYADLPEHLRHLVKRP